MWAPTTPLDWTGGPALLWVLCAALRLAWRLPGRGGVPGSISYTIAIVVIAYRWLEPGEVRRRRAAQPKTVPTGVG